MNQTDAALSIWISKCIDTKDKGLILINQNQPFLNLD